MSSHPAVEAAPDPARSRPSTTPRLRWGRVALATVAGVAVHSIVFTLLFGNPLVRGLLFTPESGQVDLVVDFWHGSPAPALTPFGAVEPGPRVLVVMAGLTVWLAIITAAFELVRGALPAGLWRRGLAVGAAAWGITYVFFETWVPYNVLHEPLPLVGLELALEAVGMLAVGLVLSAVLHERADRPRSGEA
ncbi:hypothetical protein [Salinactinospora qingdaonensis]|uniref:DUF1440 domain-containing protein n=1 Tax=Salinactinospora qingdaonensis TaxID=702744 RepID=A0ABP7GIZ9_9ACTN